MILRALEKGVLKEGGALVEPTSGNMGVSMAFCGKPYNVSMTAIVSNDLPHGKRLPIERQGAKALSESEVTELLKLGSSPGGIKLAELYARERGAVFLNQYANPWNPESYERLDRSSRVGEPRGTSVDVRLGNRVQRDRSRFGRYFKMQNPKLELVSTMPYLGQTIDGTRDLERQREALHELGPLSPIEEPIDEITARAYSAKLNEAVSPEVRVPELRWQACSIYCSFASAASGLMSCAVRTAR